MTVSESTRVQLTLLHQGIYYHQQGELEKALTCYSQIQPTDPNYVDSLHLSGLIAMEKGQFDEAYQLMSRSIEKRDHDPSFCTDYGIVLEKVDQLNQAMVYYEKAIQNKPDYQEAYFRLANLYVRDSLFIPLIKLYKRLILHIPTLKETYSTLSSVYRKLNRYHSGKKTFLNYLRLNPTNYLLYLELAKLEQESGNIPLAVEYYLTYLKHDSKNLDALNNLVFCLYWMNRTEEAFKLAQYAYTVGENTITRINVIYGMYLMNPEFHHDLLVSDSQPVTADTHDVIIISGCSMGLSGGGQNTEQVARELTRMGHRVLFYEPFAGAKKPGEISLYQDFFFFATAGASETEQNRLRHTLKRFTQSPSGQRVVYYNMFSPHLNSLIPIFREFGYKIAYYCLDDWKAMNWPHVPDWTEPQLMEQADVVFAVSEVLVDKIRPYCKSPVYKVPNGFSNLNFPILAEIPPIPDDMRFGAEKTLIYWGNLTEHWINWELLESVAARHPEWTFNLIGKLHEDKPLPLVLPNVHFLGLKMVSELQPYGIHADIGFIHFKDNDLIRAVSPIKAYEYMAVGLPIVSTPMPELNDFPYTRQVRSAEEFEQAVATLDKAQMDPSVIKQFLESGSWEQRALSLLQLANQVKSPQSV